MRLESDADSGKWRYYWPCTSGDGRRVFAGQWPSCWRSRCRSPPVVYRLRAAYLHG